MSSFKLSLTKIIIYSILLMMGVSLVMLLLAHMILLPKFAEVEELELRKDLTRTNLQLNESGRQLSNSVRDWSLWDEPFDYLNGIFPSFIEDNISIPAMQGLGVNMIGVWDKQGNLHDLFFTNVENDEYIATPAGFLDKISKSNWIKNNKNPQETNMGFLNIDSQLMVVAAAGVFPTSQEGESNGTLIMGKYVSEKEMAAWGSEFGTKLSLNTVFYEPENSINHIKIYLNQAKIVGELTIEDILENHVAIISIEKNRDIYVAGLNLVYTFLGILVLVIGMAMVVGLNLWSRILEWQSSQKSASEIAQKNNKLLEAQDKLDQHLSELQRKNQELEETKSAMLNILEDQKEAELKLEEEKASVEKKVEEGLAQLEAEKARLMASIENLSLGFLMTDFQGKVLLANHKVHEVLGVEHDPNWTIEKVDHLLGAGKVMSNAYADCIKNAQLISLEIKVSDKSHLRLVLTPIKTSEKNLDVIGVVALMEDVSEAKRLQKARDEFFAVASHELRTPLTAIRGNTALLREYYPSVVGNPEVAEIISDIHTASVRLIAIVNDFLDASRLEIDKIVFNYEQIEIVDLIREAMREVEPSMMGKVLKWEMVEREKGLIVKADKTRLHQVVVNLLGNALKFTKEGGVTVELGLTPDKEKVKIAFSDTGRGIALEDQASLFGKFKQVGGSGLSRDVSEGTGMGLYISKLIMEKMGGKIYLEKSEINKGSTFTIEIPKI